ncbi:MAG: caspase family protein [Elusimicrobiota bacterium]
MTSLSLAAMLAVFSAVPARAVERSYEYTSPPQVETRTAYPSSYAPPAIHYIPAQNNYTPPPSYSQPYVPQGNYPAQNNYGPKPVAPYVPHWDSGPSLPPVMIEFQDTFSDAVKTYLGEHAGSDGAASVKDEATGGQLRIRRPQLIPGSLVQLSRTEFRGRVKVQVVSGAQTAELEVHVIKDWDWEVSKISVAALDGVARGGYGAVRQAPAATASAPRPKAPAQLTSEVLFSEPSGNNRLDGGETGMLTVTVSNKGKGPAYAVRLLAHLPAAVPGLTVPAEVLVGELKPGQSAKREVTIEASEDVAAARAKLQVDVKEANGFDGDSMLIEFETRAFEKPRLEVAAITIGGTGIVKAGETAALTVTIRNAGAGPASAAVAHLVLSSPDLFLSGEPTASLGTLAPGQSAKVEFEFFVNKRYKAKALPVAVSVTEATGRHGMAASSLGLALGQGAPMRVMAIRGRAEAAAPAAEAEEENVDEPPKTKTPIDPEAYAVLIGIEKYRDVPGVDYAARDAQTWHAYLTRSMGFDSRNVILLQNERATLTDLATYLGPWLKDRVTAKSRVFIFYAGHGSPDPKSGEGYLIPHDGNPNYLETKAFPLRRLYANLASLPSKDVTVALDSCFSGVGGRSVLAKGTRPLVHMDKAGMAPGGDVVVLAASGGDQISSFYPPGQHGLLTYFLLKGLQGAADGDTDGRVTTSELFSYVRPAVEREANHQHVEQTPTITPALDRLGDKGRRVWLDRR